MMRRVAVSRVCAAALVLLALALCSACQWFQNELVTLDTARPAVPASQAEPGPPW